MPNPQLQLVNDALFANSGRTIVLTLSLLIWSGTATAACWNLPAKQTMPLTLGPITITVPNNPAAMTSAEANLRLDKPVLLTYPDSLIAVTLRFGPKDASVGPFEIQLNTLSGQPVGGPISINSRVALALVAVAPNTQLQVRSHNREGWLLQICALEKRRFTKLPPTQP